MPTEQCTAVEVARGSMPARRMLMRALLASALALVLAPSAPGQVAERTLPLDGMTIVRVTGAAPVQIPADALIAAMDTYWEGFRAVAAREDSEIVRIRAHARSPEGALLSPQNWERVREVQLRARAENQALISAMAQSLRQAAPPEAAATMDQIESLLEFSANQTLRGGMDNTRDYASQLYPPLRATDEQRAALFAALLANLQGRAQAQLAVQKARDAHVDAMARAAEANGVLGMDDADLEQYLKSQPKQNESGTQAVEQRNVRNAALYELNDSLRFPRASRELQLQVLGEAIKAYDLMPKELPADLRERVMWVLRPLVRSVSWADDHNGHQVSSREFVALMLRQPALSSEQRSRISAEGRALVAADYAETRRAAQALVESRSDPQDAGRAQAAMASQAQALAKLAGLELAVDANGALQVPDFANLSDSMSDSDSLEFGWTPRNGVTVVRGALARRIGQPAPYSAECAAELCLWLGVPEDMRGIVEVAVGDAQERWKRDVEAAIKEDRDHTNEALKMRTVNAEGETVGEDKRAALLAQAERARVRAYELSAACDETLVAALKATMGDAIDANLLALVLVARSAESCPVPGDPRIALQGIANLPQAVLAAPVSLATRAKMAAELAPSIPRWNAFLAELKSAALERRTWDFGMERFFARDNPETEIGKRYAALQARLDSALEAWRRQMQEDEQRVTAVVPASESDAWGLWWKRLKWPTCYVDMQPVLEARRAAKKHFDPSPEQLARMDRIIDQCATALQKSGDACVEVLRSARPDPAESPSGDDPLRQQERSLRMAAAAAGAWSRPWIAAAQIGLLFPAEEVVRIPELKTAQMYFPQKFGSSK